MTKLKNILEQGKNYAKNPLGVIALFVLLIYGFACLVLGIGGNELESIHKTILICFLVLFPCFILLSFVYLVSRHSYKLYGPSDYKDEDNYMETLNFIKEEVRINEKIDILLKEEVDQADKIKEQVKSYLEDLTGGVKEEIACAKLLSSDDNTLDNYQRIYYLKKGYEIFEKIALEKLEEELGVKIVSNSTLKDRDSMIIGFDGIVIKEDCFIGIEVKYTLQDQVSEHMKEAIKSIADRIKDLCEYNKAKYNLNGGSQQCQFILVLLHKAQDTEDLEIELNELLKDFEIYASYRLLNVNELMDFI